MHELKQWFRKYFDKAENILLLLLITVTILVIAKFGRILAPFLVSLLLAYLLNHFTRFITKKFKIRRMLAIVILYLLFTTIVVVVIAVLIPVISEQLRLFIQQIPTFITKTQNYLQSWSDRHPELISAEAVSKLTATDNFKIDNIGQLSDVVNQSLSSLSSLVEWLIYLFLVPIITFLLLKDKDELKRFYAKRFPVPQGIILDVWHQIQRKLGGYVRGIMIEALVVAVIYSILFLSCRLNYAVLLGIIGGLAVFIPVVGTLLMTIPVVIVGLFQYGTSATFILMMAGYIIIHLFDAYLLAPFLFGKTLDLHPIAVLFALIFFGGLFGFWGLVFAVPLITFIDILLDAYVAYGNAKTARTAA